MTLLIIVVGTVAVFTIGQVYFMRWAQSGVHLPVGQRTPVELPAERILVYYESPHSLPSTRCSIYVTDPYNERILPGTPVDPNEYRVRWNDWQGRALWYLDLQEEGEYEIFCTNANFASDSEVPAEDRLALLKTPETVATVNAHVAVLKVSIGSATFVLAMICYGLHALTLRHRRQKASEVTE